MADWSASRASAFSMQVTPKCFVSCANNRSARVVDAVSIIVRRRGIGCGLTTVSTVDRTGNLDFNGTGGASYTS